MNEHRFIDTHCHIDGPEFDEDRESVLIRARQAGVDDVVVIAYRERLWRPVEEMALAYEGMYYALGLHPNHADEWSDDYADRLESAITQFQPVAIGEIGLDYFRDHVDPSIQMTAFESQIQLAEKYNLPVVLHLRGDIDDALLPILTNHPAVHLVFHSFDGSRRLWEYALERGSTIGVGGLMTRPKLETLRAMIAETPLSACVLETDSPYLSPKGWKPRRNTPESIPLIAHALGDLKDVDIGEVAKITSNRARALFNLNERRDRS